MTDPLDTSTRAKRRPSGNVRKQDPVTGMFVSKLTEELIDTIETAIAGYAAPETACTLAGVSVARFRQWLATGRAWLEASQEGDIPIPEAVLAQRVEWALASQKAGLEKRVGSSDDWRASVAMLERRFSREWGKRERVDIGNPDGEEFRIAGRDLSVLSPDKLRLLREIMLELVESERVADVIDLPRRRELGTGT